MFGRPDAIHGRQVDDPRADEELTGTTRPTATRSNQVFDGAHLRGQVTENAP